MIRSPRRHEGPPKRPEQTTIPTTSLAFGAEKEGHEIRHNISLREPRVNVYSQGSAFLKKPVTSAIARLQLVPKKCPHIAAASSSGRNWKHTSTPEVGPVTGCKMS